MKLDPNPVYYVYMLFDANAIPRWVGKGKGGRVHSSASIKSSEHNQQKSKFIRRTLEALKDVPRIIIQNHLTEEKAFEYEATLIKAIGRHPNGPLVNWTDGGAGNYKEINRKRSKRQRRAHASRATAHLTPQQRSENGRKGGVASTAATSPEQKSERGRKVWTNLTQKQRRRKAQKARAGLTPEVQKENTEKAKLTYTSERRQATAKKIHEDMSPETKAKASRKRSKTLKRKGIRPPKYSGLSKSTRRNMIRTQSEKAKARWAEMSAKQRAEIGRNISKACKKKKRKPKSTT